MCLQQGNVTVILFTITMEQVVTPTYTEIMEVIQLTHSQGCKISPLQSGLAVKFIDQVLEQKADHPVIFRMEQVAIAIFTIMMVAFHRPMKFQRTLARLITFKVTLEITDPQVVRSRTLGHHQKVVSSILEKLLVIMEKMDSKNREQTQWAIPDRN